MQISSSVGQGGKNVQSDVKLVQQLLNRFTRQVNLVALQLSGRPDTQTIKFITEFQKRVAGLSKADGRIDPGSPSWKKLSGGSGAGPVNAPAKLGAAGTAIVIGGKASEVPAKGIQILKEILETVGLKHATISRVKSKPEDQARIMLENIKLHGVQDQMKCYKEAGKKVIQAYVKAKAEGKSDPEIKASMLAQINKDPWAVSHHLGDNYIVFDVMPSSIANKSKFVEIARKFKSMGKVHEFLDPSKHDPAYHFEISK